MVADGEIFTWRQAFLQGMAQHGVLWFPFVVLSCSVVGCLLNYSLFLCTMHNSALTTTIVGVMKGVVAVLLGFFIDTVAIHPLNVCGVCLNTAGGVWYSVAKYREKQKPMRRSIIASASIEPLSLMAGSTGSGVGLGDDDAEGSTGISHVYLRVDSVGRGMLLPGASERLLSSSDSASSLQGTQQIPAWREQQQDQQQQAYKGGPQQQEQEQAYDWSYQERLHEQLSEEGIQHKEQQQERIADLYRNQQQQCRQNGHSHQQQ